MSNPKYILIREGGVLFKKLSSPTILISIVISGLGEVDEAQVRWAHTRII